MPAAVESSRERIRMREAAYRKRLAADLPKWRDAGWVTVDGASAILSSLGPGRKSTFGLAATIGTLGALLLGLGVIAFVGSNWEEMPRPMRLALIVAAMALAYAAAFAFERRGHRIFAEAGALAGALVFAGGIALIGQMYHLAGDFAGAVLLFEIGVLGSALATGSLTLAVVALVAAGYWVWIGTIDANIVPHWPSLVAILIGILITGSQRAHYGRIVGVVAFMFWAAVTIVGFATKYDWSMAGGMMVFVAAALALWSLGAALAAFRDSPRIEALGTALLWPGLLAILVTVGILQLAEFPWRGETPALYAALILSAAAIALAGVAALRRGLTMVDVAAVAIIAIGSIAFAMYVPAVDFWARLAGGAIVVVAALWAVSLGQSGAHPIGKAIGLVAFGIEVIYLYIRTFGTLLDTAVAFLLGGVLFVALAFLLYRIDRFLAGRAALPAVPAGAAPIDEAPPPTRPVELVPQPGPDVPREQPEAKP